jgi:branched-chain amino acid transport system permease protein
LEEILQHLANAAVIGGAYALLGVGLTMIFGIMGVVNFTHGELYTFGAYMTYFFVMVLGTNFYVAILLAVILGAGLGALIELSLLRPLRGADIDISMVVMIGAWIVLQNVEQLVWGGVAKSIDTPFPDEPLVIGPVSVSWLLVFILFAAGALIAATHLFIHRTSIGKAMRATFQDRDTAALMGINIDFVYTLTFALGSALAAAAGALLAPAFIVTITMGNAVALKAFAIVILGGLGNFWGAALGGFILAFVEEIGAGYVSSGYRDAISFLLIILVFLMRPKGLFARAERVS